MKKYLLVLLVVMCFMGCDTSWKKDLVKTTVCWVDKDNIPTCGFLTHGGRIYFVEVSATTERVKR